MNQTPTPEDFVVVWRDPDADREDDAFAFEPTWRHTQPLYTRPAGPVYETGDLYAGAALGELMFGQDVLDWNRAQAEPPIKIGMEMHVAEAVAAILRKRKPPTITEDIEGFARITAWRYKRSKDPHHSDTYTFNRSTLLDFVRKLGVSPVAGGGE